MRNQACWLQKSESLLIHRSAARFPENQDLPNLGSSRENFAEHDLNMQLNRGFHAVFGCWLHVFSSCSVVLTEQEKRFWAALQKDEPLRNVTSHIGTGLGPWAEAEKSELVRVIYKVSGPHPSGCSKFTAVVLNSVVLNSPLLGMNVPTQVCRTCSDYSVPPTMVMLAHLHATRNRNRIDAFLRNTGAPAGSKGGQRLDFFDWCFQNHHDLPTSFMEILPTKRKQKKVRKKVTGAAKKAKTGEAVTAVVGGVAAAAGLQKVLSLLDETRRQKPMFEKQIEAIQNQVGALEKQIAGSEPEHEVV